MTHQPAIGKYAEEIIIAETGVRLLHTDGKR